MPFDGNGPADVNNIGYLTAWDGAFIAALDKRSGKEKWRGKRGLSRQAHVTPMIVEVNGRPQLISGAGDVVQGFDPNSGQRLWTIRSPGEGVVPSIVYGQGLVFTSSGYGSPAIRAVRPDGSGEATAAHIAWESRANVPLLTVISLCRRSAVLRQGIGSRHLPRCQDGQDRLERAPGRQVWGLSRAGGRPAVLPGGKRRDHRAGRRPGVQAVGEESPRRPVQRIAGNLRRANLHPLAKFLVLRSQGPRHRNGAIGCICNQGYILQGDAPWRCASDWLE